VTELECSSTANLCFSLSAVTYHVTGEIVAPPGTTACIVMVFGFVINTQGPDSSVGIATDYGLTVRGSNPGGARFFAHVQTGPGSHQASCTVQWVPGLSQRVKRPGRGADTHPLLVPRSRKSSAIPLSPYRSLVACYRVTFTFTFN
jgi:hypothetical protein